MASRVAAPVAATKRGTATRMVTPLIPLAVALVGAHVLAPSVPATSPATAPMVAPVTMTGRAVTTGGLAPLLSVGQPVDWWLVFKFNSESFPGCAGTAVRACPFGGTVQDYDHFSQQFVYASSANKKLQDGGGCVGDTATDPVGATFQQVYDGNYFYVVWNDQFDGDPINTKSAPAGHSKGMLAWDNNGNGFVMQVSTPSWPGSGNMSQLRQTDGNTLGCVKDDDVLVSQHFFSLRLNKSDVVDVLRALGNASVVTNPSKLQIVNNGGPQEITSLVSNLGRVSASKNVAQFSLSSGVVLISKASGLHVPPWQMVSAQLGGEPLRVVSWFATPEIASTTASSTVGCWDASLAKPGPVEIATTGTWEGRTLGFLGVPETTGNHAKIGVSMGTHSYVIAGDMNQQGSLSGPNCDSSQNGRGGLFYVLNDPDLKNSVSSMIQGDSAAAK